jgi:SCY1-like protein 1
MYETDLMSSPFAEHVSQTLGGQLPDAMAWASPEVKKGGWSTLKEYAALEPSSFRI